MKKVANCNSLVGHSGHIRGLLIHLLKGIALVCAIVLQNALFYCSNIKTWQSVDMKVGIIVVETMRFASLIMVGCYPRFDQRLK